ncbi:shikimate dehydrogenase [Verrucomicrobium sp. BvORR034]|uniref:shikimate dehydrogenase n=1 Tax=Verrucomicrobium sp. BvORR034 TaxID=1396418 RepID=UPI000678C4AB|nr:shikimate dehydrogenase [Verrucomicrobium sp. BvORR034]
MSKACYTLEDLRNWTSVSAEIDPPARLAVIGDPIAHSRSPQMHNPALKARGIDAQYIRVHVPPGSVAEALDLFALHGFVGVNCTIPHKFEALEAMDELNGLAVALGAVNTVHLHDGQKIGYNSDGPGFLRSVEEAFGAAVKDLRVLIIGAGGGAGQAVAIQSALEGCPSLRLANRTVAKLAPLVKNCQQLSATTQVTALTWSDEEISSILDDVDLIVNATPVGMKDGDGPLFDYQRIQPSHLAYDMVYRAASPTPFISAAKASGARTCDGLRLLLHQGAISFGHWFGEPVPLEAMRSGLTQS